MCPHESPGNRAWIRKRYTGAHNIDTRSNGSENVSDTNFKQVILYIIIKNWHNFNYDIYDLKSDYTINRANNIANSLCYTLSINRDILLHGGSPNRGRK